MNFIYSPSAFLVGKTTINECAVAEFLKEHEVNWSTDSSEGSEVVAEMGGRLCYMSFAHPRPGGNKAYLNRILESGHGSVLEHGVYNFIFSGISRSLTHELVRHRAGFGYCLAGNTLVYSGSRDRGRFNGVRKKWTIKKLFDWSKDPAKRGKLKLLRVRCFDGSEFVSSKIRGVSYSGVKPVFAITLEDGKQIKSSIDHRFMTPKGWASVGDIRPGDLLGTNGIAAIGLAKDWLADRYISKRMLLREIASEAECSVSVVRKYLKKYGLQKPIGQGQSGRKPWNIGRSYATGFHHTEETKKHLSDQKLGDRNPSWLGDDASDQAGRQRAQRYFKPKPCAHCGVENAHRHHKDRNPKNNTESNIEFLCASCHTSVHASEDGPLNRLKIKWVAVRSIQPCGSEATYDLEVDHEAHNFVANGFVTHNSQLSQRYVDSLEVAFVVPSIIAKHPELMAAFTVACHSSLDAYEKISQFITKKIRDGHVPGVSENEDKTAARKAARQAARSVLPNATETKIMASANCRAWRHFLEMRGSIHAEPEIRRLAACVASILIEECPNIFGDFSVEVAADGEFTVQSKHRKV